MDRYQAAGLAIMARGAARRASGLILPRRDPMAFPRRGRHAKSWVGEHLVRADGSPVEGGGFQSWQESLATAQVAGSPLTNVTATTILPPAARFTLPANFFYIGRCLKITATGQISNIVTTPGTFTFDVRMGPTSNIIVFNGAAGILSTTAHTSLPFWFEALLTCRSIGNGVVATLIGQAFCMGQSFSFTSNADLATSNSVGSLMLPNTTPAVGTGFDSTVAMVADLFGTWSINNAGNTITLQQYLLEALN